LYYGINKGLLMRPHTEKIQLLPGESFRLLHWKNNIHEVEIITAERRRIPLTGSGHEWHSHSHMELTMIDQGSGTRFIGDSITHFTAPDLVIIGPHLPHYWHMRGQSSGYAVQFDFDPGHAFWKFPETWEMHELWKGAQRGIRVTGADIHKINLILQECCECSGMKRLMLFIRILEILTQLPALNRQAISRTAFVPPISQSTYMSLQRAIQYVLENFQSDISFPEVLQQSRMSKATFERHFKKMTGKSFTRFLADVRLNFAGRRLLESDLPVSEIAFASGYNNLSHFNHQFKALHQLSPLSFRTSMRYSRHPADDIEPRQPF